MVIKSMILDVSPYLIYLDNKEHASVSMLRLVVEML